MKKNRKVLWIFIVLLLIPVLAYGIINHTNTFAGIISIVNLLEKKSTNMTLTATNLIKDSKTEADMKKNSQYLQSLIDKVHKAGGGTVKMPAGAYYFAPNGSNIGSPGRPEGSEYYAIYMKSNVTLEGAGADEKTGTILKPVGRYDLPFTMIYYNQLRDYNDTTYLENAGFKNFLIDGELMSSSIYNASGKGINILLCKNCFAEGVTIKNTWGTGFAFDAPINCKITNCVAIGCGRGTTTSGAGASGFGIGTGYSADESITISNSTAIGNRKFGFFFEHQARFQGYYKATTAKGFIVENSIGSGNMYNFGGVKATDVILRNSTSYESRSGDPNPLNNANVAAVHFEMNSRRIQMSNMVINQSFADVDKTSEYYGAVYWAVRTGIAELKYNYQTDSNNNIIYTNPKAKAYFSPSQVATRAHAITYLWRMAGYPGSVLLHGQSVESGFADVGGITYNKVGTWYSDAVKWGKDTKILNPNNTNFYPNDDCTKAAFLTMLWRYAGSPVVTTKHNFSDVPSGSYYENAVNWALNQGIIEKTSNGLWNPNAGCTRGEMIVMLYRYKNSPKTVTYNYTANGGTEASKKTDSKRVGQIVDLTPTAKKNGYRFIGWNTDKNATVGLSSLEMPANNLTVYAIFKEELKVTSSSYTVDSTENYIYLGTENNIVTIKNNLKLNDSSATLRLVTASGVEVTTGTINSGTKVQVLENNQVIKEFKLIHIGSDLYDLKKSYLYLGTSSLNLDKINVVNATTIVENNKLKIRYQEKILQEFDLLSIQTNHYKIEKNTIYIDKSAISFNEFKSKFQVVGVELKAYRSDQEVTDVKGGDTIQITNSKYGVVETYQVVAEYLEFKNLTVDESKLLIKKVDIGTITSKLLSSINTSGTVQVLDKNEKMKTQDSKLATGDVVKITLKNQVRKYQISVKGDVTGDGKANIADVAKAYAHVRGEKLLTKDCEKDAIDVVEDGNILINDIAKLYDQVRKEMENEK